MRKHLALGLSAVLALAGAVQADDWTVTRLRGGVFVLTDGQWQQLFRGSVVSDDRVIKSAPNSRATFVRDAESVELGPDTTAQIADIGGFTTVYNHAGVVGVDAEARNVQHFAVQTPHLAAVVKGTAFVVEAETARSTVAVTRGQVEVNDERFGSTVSLAAGQEVSSSSARAIAPEAVVPVLRSLPAPPPPVVLPRAAVAQAGQRANAGPARPGGNADPGQPRPDAPGRADDVPGGTSGTGTGTGGGSGGSGVGGSGTGGGSGNGTGGNGGSGSGTGGGGSGTGSGTGSGGSGGGSDTDTGNGGGGGGGSDTGGGGGGGGSDVGSGGRGGGGSGGGGGGGGSGNGGGGGGGGSGVGGGGSGGGGSDSGGSGSGAGGKR